MSVVISQFFNHKKGNDEYQLKSYGLDDKFYLNMESYNTVSGWRNKVYMDFSVAEAKILKKQLEEFIEQNK